MQGKSAGEECPFWILNTLFENEKMGFEELVREGGSRKNSFSRGTINKYLDFLYESKLVARENLQNRRRGKYYITQKGKEQLFSSSNKVLEKATVQWLNIVTKLVQEGNARILTRKELEQEKHWQNLSKIPIEIDDEGLHKLGITEGQIMLLDMFKELDKKLEREGILMINTVQGKKGFYRVERK